jgi:hypothetical protein
MDAQLFNSAYHGSATLGNSHLRTGSPEMILTSTRAQTRRE